MDAIWITDIGGLFHEMSELNADTLKSNAVEIQNDYLDGSGCFWKQIFKRERIERLIEILLFNRHSDKYKRPQYCGIIANPENFVERVLRAPIDICADDCPPKLFFSYLETMEILCQLYSDFEYSPFKLTVQNGFLLDDISSEALYQKCLNPCENPYIPFIQKEIVPVIRARDPKVLFLSGKLSYYLAAIAMNVKNILPNVHICVTRHASEYYSLNKISSLLLENHTLFQIVDSIILEFFDQTEKLLSVVFDQGGTLSDVPNLIYVDHEHVIHKTNYVQPTDVGTMMVDQGTGQILDIHLEPFVKCHWNQCSFCGINQKYHYTDQPSSEKIFAEKLLQIKNLAKKYHYLWFIDEALSPARLRILAKGLLEDGISVYWEARCRADQALLQDDLPSLLAQSGLRELRIGLESASYFVLGLMNKFDHNFRLEMLESIIQTYGSYGIAIHCPMILGFPREEQSERQKTYAFLSEMRKKYPLFTFNLNILNLDISSQLFKKWPEFHLQRLDFPCPPQHFLGNCLAWLPAREEQELDRERQQFTRQQIYPWMPPHSLIAPTVLYRLSETSRFTLVWRQMQESNLDLFSADMVLSIAPDLTVLLEATNQYFIYNWNSHHYMQGNQYLWELLDAFRSPRSVMNVINDLTLKKPDVYWHKELVQLIRKLFVQGYLVGKYQMADVQDEVQLKTAYNHIYQTGDYFYLIEPDELLTRRWGELLPGQALELGIGMGKNVSFLLEKGFSITGVDFAQVAVNQLRFEYPDSSRCHFYAEDIRTFWIQPNYYSLIVCSMTLSYLKDIELELLVSRIKEGLVPGGCVFLNDLSDSDPLYHIPPDRTTEHRYFFTKEKILRLFKDFELLELEDIYRKESRRVGCEGYFGLLSYLGRKPEDIKKERRDANESGRY